MSFNLKKPIYIALKSIPITLKPHFCPYSTIIFLEVLEIAFLKMKKHYNKSIFTIMMIKKKHDFLLLGGQEDDDWLNNRK